MNSASLSHSLTHSTFLLGNLAPVHQGRVTQENHVYYLRYTLPNPLICHMQVRREEKRLNNGCLPGENKTKIVPSQNTNVNRPLLNLQKKEHWQTKRFFNVSRF